jgi:hypothetical protein
MNKCPSCIIIDTQHNLIRQQDHDIKMWQKEYEDLKIQYDILLNRFSIETDNK